MRDDDLATSQLTVFDQRLAVATRRLGGVAIDGECDHGQGLGIGNRRAVVNDRVALDDAVDDFQLTVAPDAGNLFNSQVAHHRDILDHVQVAARIVFDRQIAARGDAGQFEGVVAVSQHHADVTVDEIHIRAGNDGSIALDQRSALAGDLEDTRIGLSDFDVIIRGVAQQHQVVALLQDKDNIARHRIAEQ